jgi:hypothetical protein
MELGMWRKGWVEVAVVFGFAMMVWGFVGIRIGCDNVVFL